MALGSQALSLIASLLEDVEFEVRGEEAAGGEVASSSSAQQQVDSSPGTPPRVEPATLDLFHPFTATQRIALVFNSVPFIQLLFNVAIISYRKASNIRSVLSRRRGSKGG